MIRRAPWLFALLCLALRLTRGDDALAEPQSFRTGVLPILTKAGCNSGACHGAATGQGGFSLSLLGYDPEEDFEKITRELKGRRIDLENPRESLVLRKPSGQLDHDGGRRLGRTSDGYQAVLAWIEAGAPYGRRDLQVAEIHAAPSDLLANRGESFQIQTTAILSDVTRQDVSSLALYTSNDEAIAAVTKEGQVSTVGPGVTSIMIRYGGQVAATRIAVPFNATPATAPAAPSPRNFIDEHVIAELNRLGLPLSPGSSDSEFLRRVCLDLAGRLPTFEEARAFASSGPEERRERLIDRLLASEEFVDLWTMRLADLLLIGGKKGAEEATRVYHAWLRGQVAANTPLDKIAAALLTSQGSVLANGPANFYTLATDPRDMAEHVSRIFLGTQIACARCHAHPSDRWTQDDYYQFAAFFSRVERQGETIKLSNRGGIEHPKTGAAVAPKVLGADRSRTGSADDPRADLAAWITAPDNPRFASSFVNRVWKHLLGRGLVEPVEDLRPTNPATHPALLDALARDFVSHKFDLRRLIRTVVSSRIYQLSSEPLPGNAADTQFYSRAYLKELPAQVFVDAVSSATGVAERFEGYPERTRAIQLVGAMTPSYALDVLGRCAREATCESSSRAGGGLAQVLHLINGDTINAKLAGGVAAELVERNASDREIVETLYLRTLARPPAPPELAAWEPMLRAAPRREEAAQDLLWTLLNSREFGFNH